VSGDDQLPLEGFDIEAQTSGDGAPAQPEAAETEVAATPVEGQTEDFDEGVTSAESKPAADTPIVDSPGLERALAGNADKDVALPVSVEELSEAKSDAPSSDYAAPPEELSTETPTSESAPALEPPATEPGSVTEDLEAVPSASVGVVASDPSALYFLTNRMNLNGVLSSRLVAPRESHDKYYVDLLEQVPGWVPLLTQPPTQALIEAVTVERGAGKPVVIEFPLGVVKETELRQPVAYVPALALSQAVAIHFREEKDLREHRARGFKNIHPHDELLKVTPELFSSDAPGEVALTAPAGSCQVSWRRIDRIRGAINAALASVQSGEQLVVAAAFLGEVKFPPAIVLPEWISWCELDDHGDVAERVSPDLGVSDHVGFRVVYEVLGEQDASEAWSPNAVLDGVATRIQGAGLAAGAADALIQNLQRVRSIVNVEADFEPFRPTARALVSAKALLLVLLRSELEELLAWPEEQTGADDLTRVTAAVLAGRLRGLAREATTLRSLALDDLTAAWAVRVARGEGGVLGKVQFSATTRGTSLTLDGIELSTQDALLPDPVAQYHKVDDVKKESLRIAVSRAVGWPVTHRITVPTDAAKTEDAGVLTILTPGEVQLVVSVDEEDFLSKLGALAGAGKRKALAAFDLQNAHSRD
jgi:hypothetical protein